MLLPLGASKLSKLNVPFSFFELHNAQLESFKTFNNYISVFIFPLEYNSFENIAWILFYLYLALSDIV